MLPDEGKPMTADPVSRPACSAALMASGGVLPHWGMQSGGKCAIMAVKQMLKGRGSMASYLIKDTTREEREQIVADAIGNITAACDGCSEGIVEMYQDYIDGKKELRQVNMEFNARYVSGRQGPPDRVGCGMGC